MIHTRQLRRIKKTSLFSYLRELKRVGQLAVWSDECEESKDVIDRFATVALPDAHPAKRYLGYGQNDAEALGIEFGKESLTVTLNHYDVARLASVVLEDAAAWPRLRSAFPVGLRFEGISELLILRIVEQGVYQRIRSRQRSIACVVNDVIQMECIAYTPSQQHYILEFNGLGRPFSRNLARPPSPYNDGYAFCIQATDLVVNEHYRQGWKHVFDGKNLDVLDAFEQVWPVPAWGKSNFEEWIGNLREQGGLS